MSHLLLSCLALIVALAAFVRACRDHLHSERRIQELQRKILEAQRNLRRLGDLANEVAHEIKNPITAILCSAETLDLLIGEQIDPIHRKSLQYMKEYGEHVLTIVSDFLDVSRAEAGHLTAKPEAVRIADTVDTIVGLLDANAIRRQVVIKKFFSDPELRGYIDPRHLKQIVFNLLHNAVKFTPVGGEVHILVKDDFPEQFLQIAVKDNGIGIAPDEVEHLFDPYQTSSGGAAGLDAGAGLGLALCKTLVEMAGGSIEVRSTPGVGSCFEIRIPRHDQVEISPDDPAAPGDGRPLEGQRFLVVDEHAGSREAVSRLIEAWGGMVDRVGLAIDAVEALEHTSYDAIMIDDSVDGVFAHELSRMMRQELDVKDTTIIVATKEEANPHLVRESCADRWLEKPLSGKSLLQSLIKSGKYSITH